MTNKKHSENAETSISLTKLIEWVMTKMKCVEKNDSNKKHLEQAVTSILSDITHQIKAKK